MSSSSPRLDPAALQSLLTLVRAHSPHPDTMTLAEAESAVMAVLRHVGPQLLQAALDADNAGITVAQLYGVATGTDTYTVTLSTGMSALTVGLPFYVKFGITNTGAATLAVNGLAATAIRKGTGGATALSASDLVVTKIYTLIYDGTNFQINL